MTAITTKSIDDNVRAIDKGLKQVTASAIKSQDDDALSRLTLMRETLAALVEQVRKELPKGEERKNLVNGLTIMHNHTASVIDLALDKELSSEAANEFISKNQKRILKVSTLISSLRKVQAKSSVQQKEEAANEGHSVNELFALRADEIRRYQHYRDVLPRTNREVTKDFIIKPVPVVVLTKPIVTAQEFKKAGFRSEPIDGFYSVLENQLVVGLNSAKLKAEGKNIKQYRQAILKVISAQYKKRFVVMSEMNIGLGTTGFIYTWIMPESEYDRITNTIHKRFNVAEWGFAFKP